MKYLYWVALWCVASTYVFGESDTADTSRLSKQIDLGEILIQSSPRESSDLSRLPLSSTTLSVGTLRAYSANSLKDVSMMVPNLFMPDYGSKLTSTLFIRGVGSRMTSSAVALYVDNVPMIDKTGFDSELYDIASIEVLRGPQGTLYGRNSLGGLIHIHTRSPFDVPGGRARIGLGGYGQKQADLSYYGKIGEHFGYGASGYIDSHDGFFTNQATGKKVDRSLSSGGRLKLGWKINEFWLAELSSSYDYLSQGGYPYRALNTTDGSVSEVNYNDPSDYLRRMTNHSLMFQYRNEHILFTSATGYQYLNDRLRLDQDFSPMNIFTMRQSQQLNALNQEWTVRSNNDSRWQWVAGISGYYQYNDMEAPVLFKKDGISHILQPVFDRIASSNPKAPKITIKDAEMPIEGEYRTPSYGVGVFHQSTINDLLIKGLSLTLGIRAEHERVQLDHFTTTTMNVNVKMTQMPISIPFALKDTIQGRESVSYTQLLPKAALSYTLSQGAQVYANVSKGYKSGGYNFQMFSDLIQEGLMNSMPGRPKTETNYSDRITYQPEWSWNYEVGFRGDLLNGKLSTDLALYYIDIRNQQITQFAPNGLGRMARNAARSASKGGEISVSYKPISALAIDASYGFTHATFSEYNNGVHPDSAAFENHTGNYVPLSPKHTFSISAGYLWTLPKNPIVDQVHFLAQYCGNGRIYWTEQNNLSQPFYGTANARISLIRERFRFSLWGKNLTNTAYQAFYFESRNQPFVQIGKPLQLGLELSCYF